MWGTFRKSIYRLLHWEYWPAYAVYLPVFFVYLYYAAKARSLYFFTASNPAIPTGGAFGESKSAILSLLPKELVPEFVLIQPDIAWSDQLKRTYFEMLRFPLIAKPDVGERGNGVAVIHDQMQLDSYHLKARVPYLLQKYVDLPLELGLFYIRMPNETKGEVTSLTGKAFLNVIGDGHKSLKELALQNPRAQLVWTQLNTNYSFDWSIVPKAGEKIILEPIGNHCRGTAFVNHQAQISEEVLRYFDQISHTVPGFYYGRFDLRCSGWEALAGQGELKILELNGCSAEPAHIYESGFLFFKAQCVLFDHVAKLYQISKANHDLGVPYLRAREIAKAWKLYKESLSSV